MMREHVALEQEVRIRRPESHLTARVLVTPPRSHYDTIVIGAGSTDGVLEQDVVTVGGIAVGVVTEAYSYSSVASLYSSPGTSFDARIGTEDAVTTVYGVGGGALEAKVPSELGVTPGDTVIDPRTGYVFGTVHSVTTRDIDTEAYVRIALPVSLSGISLVSLTHRTD
jgi:cell shape-determining protein MreC